MDLDKQIEALLFWKGEPLSVEHVARSTKHKNEEVEAALTTLEEKLKDRGIVLQRNGDEVTLGTASEMSATIERVTKEELDRELSKASLETLSIILYKGPIRRSEIDFIRGVNSTFTLRALLIRGLIEKVSDPTDERAYLYKPTFELFSYLGVRSTDELPEFEKVKRELDAWQRSMETEGGKEVKVSSENDEPSTNASESNATHHG